MPEPRRALEQAGARSVHVVAEGGGPQFHSLVGPAVQALRRCLKGMPLDAIKAELDKPDLRKLVPPERE